jgi:hypothetical protein
LGVLRGLRCGLRAKHRQAGAGTAAFGVGGSGNLEGFRA